MPEAVQSILMPVGFFHKTLIISGLTKYNKIPNATGRKVSTHPVMRP